MKSNLVIAARLCLSSLVLLLAACQPAPERTFVPNNSFGAESIPNPAGAEELSPEVFKGLVEAGGYEFLNNAKLLELENAEKTKLEADRTLVNDLVVQNPDLADVLKVPDPSNTDAKPTADGNYLVEVDTEAGKKQVVTMGADFVTRSVASSQRLYSTKENQFNIFKTMLEVLPEESRTGLPTQEEASNYSSDQLQSINQIASVRVGDVLDNINLDQDAPAGYVANPNNEDGAGNGSDRTACVPHKAAGLYANFNYPLKYFATSVKDQGRRGTCTSFAVNGAIEAKLASQQGLWTNLSEQDLYGIAKFKWFPTPGYFGDGLGAASTMQASKDESGYQFKREAAWDYNPSRSREEVLKVIYKDSCKNYTDNCSDTNHQQKIHCTHQGGQRYCAYKIKYEPDTSHLGFNPLRVRSYSSFWNLTSSRAVSLSMLKGYLVAKKPVVLGIPVTPSFRSPDANGFVSPKFFQESAGGHAILAVGFISADQARTKLPFNDVPQGNGGGWVIIKNSWGCSWGDAGYGYLPYSWVQHYVLNATALESLTSYTPYVKLTSNTSTVSTSTGLKLTATALPILNLKRVGKVEFFDGPSKIGEVNSSNLNGPGIFEFNVPLGANSSNNGTHHYSARAITTDGLPSGSRIAGLSNTVNVNININQGPKPSVVLNVSSNPITSGAVVTFGATTSSNVNRVEFYRGLVKVATDASPPFSFQKNFVAGDNGSILWFAKAYTADNEAVSEGLNVTVNIQGIMANWYVNPTTGSDSYDGLSASSAFKTICKAKDVVQAGQTIGLMNGEYNQSNQRPAGWNLNLACNPSLPNNVNVIALESGQAVLKGITLNFLGSGEARGLHLENDSLNAAYVLPGITGNAGTLKIAELTLGDVFSGASSLQYPLQMKGSVVATLEGSVNNAFLVPVVSGNKVRTLAKVDGSASLTVIGGVFETITSTSTDTYCSPLFYVTGALTLSGVTIKHKGVVVAAQNFVAIRGSSILENLSRAANSYCTATLQLSGTASATVTASTLRNGQDGIASVMGSIFSGQISVNNSSLNQNTKHGISVSGSSVTPATISLDNSSITQNGLDGISLTGRVNFDVRGSNLSNNGNNGLQFDGLGSSSLDLGTNANPGGNTIRDNTNTGLRVKANSSMTVNAAGNTWKANEQNANGSGQYTTQLLTGVLNGTNFLLENANSKLQL